MDLERIWKYISKETSGCWRWTGGTTWNGYGKCGHLGKTVSAHRISYQLFVGEIPDRLQVMHMCDNRLCVNPEHLKLGTNSDNMQDAISKGRPIGRKFDEESAAGMHRKMKRLGIIPDLRKHFDPDILDMHKMRREGWSAQVIADKYDTNYKYVWKVVTGKVHAKLKLQFEQSLISRGDI